MLRGCLPQGLPYWSVFLLVGAPPDNEREAVGGFHPLCSIAQSYLGSLWLALDKRGGEPGKPVLLRRVQLPSQTPIESLQRVACAARDAMALSHENILSVVGVSHEERSLAVAYAYVEAEPLSSLQTWCTRAGRQFPVGVSLRIIIDLARGVKALHGALLGWPSAPPFGGLSPDSVLVARDGRTRVSDPLVSSCATLLEGIGLSASKLAYSAPEQVHATTPLGVASDVFVCTVMLWELLTGQRLLSGSRDDIERKLLEHDLPKLSDHLPSDVAISKGLAQIVARSLAWDADRRPPTPAALATELEQCGHEVASIATVADFVAELAGPHFERRAIAVRSRFPPALRGQLGPAVPLPRTSGLFEAIGSAPEPAAPSLKIHVAPAPVAVEVPVAAPAAARRIVPLPAKASGPSRAVRAPLLSSPKAVAAPETKPVVAPEPKAANTAAAQARKHEEPSTSAATFAKPQPATIASKSAKPPRATKPVDSAQPPKPEPAPRPVELRGPELAPVPLAAGQPEPPPAPAPAEARPPKPEPTLVLPVFEPEPALALPALYRTDRAPAPLTERSHEHEPAANPRRQSYATSEPPRAPIPRAGRAPMRTLVGVAAPAVPVRFAAKPMAAVRVDNVPEIQRVDELAEFLAEPVSSKPEPVAAWVADPDGGPTLVSHTGLPSYIPRVDLDLDALIADEEPTEVSLRAFLPEDVQPRYVERDVETEDVLLDDIEPTEIQPLDEIESRNIELPDIEQRVAPLPEARLRHLEPPDVQPPPASVPSKRSSGWSHAPRSNFRLRPRALIASVVATIAVAFGVVLVMFLRPAPSSLDSPPAATPVAAAARGAGPVLSEPNRPPPSAQPLQARPDTGVAPDAAAAVSNSLAEVAGTSPIGPVLALDLAAPGLRDEQLVQLFALESRTKLPSCAERLGATARRHKGKDFAKSQAQLKAARRALIQGDYPKVQLLLCSAIGHSAANRAAWQTLAELALNAGDAARAKETIEKALKKKPKDPVLLGLLGDASALLGELQRSRTLWAQSAQVPGSGGERSRRLVALFGAIGDRKLAGASYGSALSYYRRAAVLSAGAHGPSAGMAEALRRLAQTAAATPWAERIELIASK